MTGKTIKSSRTLNRAKPVSALVRNYVRNSVKRYIRKEGEEKHGYSRFNVNATTTPVYNQLNNVISVGTADTNNRIGDKYTITKLELGFNLSYGDPTNILRIIIFQWLEDSVPTDSDIFEDTTDPQSKLLGSLCSDSIKGKVLRVLKDIKVACNTYQPNMYWRTSISGSKMRPLQMVGGSASAGVGNIYCCYMSDSSAIAHPVLQCNWTLHYMDL